jgi:malonyl-CoA O-methyltransferase
MLDVGCGTARRLDRTHDPVPVGVDASPEMLSNAVRGPRLAAADARALPFAAGSFDVVWCRLMIGHVRDVDGVYRELARVCRAGADLVVTDFHPAAVAAGHTRTFRDAAGTVHAIEHHVHSLRDHDRAATAAGLRLVAQREGVVGASIRPFYERAGKPESYAMQEGLPLVLARAYRRQP